MNYQFPQPYQVVKVNGERGAEALPMYPQWDESVLRWADL